MKDLWKSITCLLVLVAIGLSETKTLKHEYVQASDDSFTAQVELLETRLTDKWHPSVKALQLLIKRDPMIEYNWVYGLSLCTATIKNRTSDQVLSLINAALLTPPAYFNTPLVGFPINSVLIEFMQTENGRNFFSHREVNAIFKEIMDQYNRMIQSPQSTEFLNDKEPYGWFSPTVLKKVDYSEYDCNPEEEHYGFQNWNQWFLRRFKDVRSSRPLHSGAPNGVAREDMIVNGCESTPLDSPIQPVRNVKATDTFWLKETPYSLSHMFGEQGQRKGYPSLFAGGTVYQAFLSALSYHRWHSPVKGVVRDIYKLPGTYFSDQSQINVDYDSSSPDRSQAFIASVATRQVFIIESSNPKIGKIAIIYIGMAEVSSCVETVRIGARVNKGDDLGYFAFGGSSHAMVFQKHVNLVFSNSLYEEKDGVKSGQRQNLRSYLAHVVPAPDKDL